MLIVQDVLISDDVIEQEFICNLSACKGACCVKGEAGAPLEKKETKILEDIYYKFAGWPVGLNTIAAAVGEEESTIEEVVEPYLLQIGFLERTPRWRKITQKATEHLLSKK